MSKIVKQLEVLGFTEYEARVLEALIDNDSMKAAEISARSGVPRGKIYSVLNSLSERGIVASGGGKVNKYFARGVDTLLKASVESQMASLVSARDKVLEELERQRVKRGHPVQKEGRLVTSTQDSIKSLSELVSKSKKELYLISIPSWVLRAILPSLESAHDRGVKIRWVLPFGDRISGKDAPLKKISEIKVSSVKVEPLVGIVEADMTHTSDVFVEGDSLKLYESAWKRCAECGHDWAVEMWSRAKEI